MFEKLLFLFVFLHFLSLNSSVFALDKSYCKCRSQVSSRIIGGRISKPNAFPWQISLGLLPDTPWEIKPEKFKVGKRENLPNFFKTATHICAGAILSENLVLTAAHCVTDDALNPKVPTHFGVGFGNKHNLIDIYNNGRIRVEQIFVHPHYNVSLTDTVHDIAIVKLSQPLNFESESVRPACVLQENEGGRMKDYGEVISTGWGSENVMKFNYITRTWEGYKASLQLKEATFQDVSHNSSTCKTNNKLICISPIVANESVCKGDSGGPLHYIQQGYTFVNGVTSFGSTKKIGPFSIQACSGEAGYTRLQSSLEWVKSITGDDICLYEQVNNDRVRLYEKDKA